MKKLVAVAVAAALLATPAHAGFRLPLVAKIGIAAGGAGLAYKLWKDHKANEQKRQQQASSSSPVAALGSLLGLPDTQDDLKPKRAQRTR